MVTIEQNNIKNIIVNKDDKSFVVPSGTSIKKYFALKKLKIYDTI